MTEAEIRIARTFHPCDWVELTPAFLRIRSFAGGRTGLALACINRDLREERLRAALVRTDGTIKMLLEAPDWQQRTVCAPHIPAEGVRVEPYEEGCFFIWRADLDEWYSANPATPATPADRQLCAEGGSEPVARAEKMESATAVAEVSQSATEARIETEEASPSEPESGPLAESPPESKPAAALDGEAAPTPAPAAKAAVSVDGVESPVSATDATSSEGDAVNHPSLVSVAVGNTTASSAVLPAEDGETAHKEKTEHAVEKTPAPALVMKAPSPSEQPSKSPVAEVSQSTTEAQVETLAPGQPAVLPGLRDERGKAGSPTKPLLLLKDWLPVAVKTHVKATDVPDKVSTFARMLFNDAKAAFEQRKLTKYPASWQSIETMLHQLKLWPPPKYPRK
jgi:hypothetical protein